MKLILKLGWRNIWRNKRRSLLTLAAISFATFASIAMRGVQNGTYNLNIDYAVNLFTGAIQIQQDDYQKNPSLRKCFTPDQSIISTIKSIPEIKAYSERVYADGLISRGDKSFGAGIFGIQPDKEKNVMTLLSRIKQGKFFDSDTSNQIVIGYKLLDNLKAQIGDTVVILTQGYDGALGNLKFVIGGTVKVGSAEFDAMGVFMGLKTAQELLALPNRVHAIAISLNSVEDIKQVKKELSAKINNDKLSILDWEELMPDFKQSIEYDNVSGLFFLFILVLIVAFGILNTVLMSITERFREFGVALAIGMQQKKLLYLVLAETIFITIIGVLAGNIIGWGINNYIVHNPIIISSNMGALYEEYGFLPRIESSLQSSIFINTDISVIIISIIAVLYPLYKVYLLEPLKGIRYT